MIIAVVQIAMPRRPREAAIAAQTKSAPTYRALAAQQHVGTCVSPKPDEPEPNKRYDSGQRDGEGDDHCCC